MPKPEELEEQNVDPEEQVEDEDTPEDEQENLEGNDDDPENKDDQMSDDTPITITTKDGKQETVTLEELRSGYMRQSDYTRKSQEIAEMKKQFQGASQEEKKEVTNKAQEVIDNPENYSDEDVETARTLLKIVKAKGIAKEFGFITQEELQAEKEKEKRVQQVNNQFKEAESKVKEMKGMPKFDDDEVLEHMEKTGIHNPFVAYKDLHDSQYRNYIIKQAKGDTSYKSDKGGRKPEPKAKEIDVRTEEGHRSFLSDEIKKLGK
jgi:hypothetical protein